MPLLIKHCLELNLNRSKNYKKVINNAKNSHNAHEMEHGEAIMARKEEAKAGAAVA